LKLIIKLSNNSRISLISLKTIELDTVKRDEDDGVTVTTFNDQHQALKTQITELLKQNQLMPTVPAMVPKDLPLASLNCRLKRR
jgi:hypothetical protein